MNQSPLLAKDINELYLKYATEETLNELSNPVTETRWEVDGEEYEVAYLGRVVEYTEEEGFKEEWVKGMVELVNWLVEKGYLFYGKLCPMMRMELVHRSEDGQLVTKEGFVMNKHFIATDERVELDTIIKREMILFYALGRYSQKELNEKCGNEYFNVEGALPNAWEGWTVKSKTK